VFDIEVKSRAYRGFATALKAAVGYCRQNPR
jgi:hypothetical protein